MMFASFLLAAALMQPVSLPTGAVLDDHARRGAMARLDGAAAVSAPACASACALAEGCQAWTWKIGGWERPARCELHPIAGPASPRPGAVTGLAPALAAQIEAGAERPPSAREQAALASVASRAPAVPPPQGLAGGP